MEAYVVNPYLFVSKASGEYLSQESDRILYSNVPKQLSDEISDEVIKETANAIEKASNTIILAQLIAQICLKGSMETIISLYYALQLICYVKAIFLINKNYPTILQIFIDELTNLIEFKAL